MTEDTRNLILAIGLSLLVIIGWNHFFAMFFGDIAGSILFIALIKYGIDLVKGRLGKDNLVE